MDGPRVGWAAFRGRRYPVGRHPAGTHAVPAMPAAMNSVPLTANVIMKSKAYQNTKQCACRAVILAPGCAESWYVSGPGRYLRTHAGPTLSAENAPARIVTGNARPARDRLPAREQGRPTRATTHLPTTAWYPAEMSRKGCKGSDCQGQ